MNWDEQREQVRLACAQLPEQFRLRGVWNEIFRVNVFQSYWNESLQRPIIVFDVLKDGVWLPFSKGSLAEIRTEMRTL
jgi:hypothetical protein